MLCVLVYEYNLMCTIFTAWRPANFRSLFQVKWIVHALTLEWKVTSHLCVRFRKKELGNYIFHCMSGVNNKIHTCTSQASYHYLLLPIVQNLAGSLHLETIRKGSKEHREINPSPFVVAQWLQANCVLDPSFLPGWLLPNNICSISVEQFFHGDPTAVSLMALRNW